MLFLKNLFLKNNYCCLHKVSSFHNMHSAMNIFVYGYYSLLLMAKSCTVFSLVVSIIDN